METLVDFEALEGAFRKNTGRGGVVGTDFASRQVIGRHKTVLEIFSLLVAIRQGRTICGCVFRGVEYAVWRNVTHTEDTCVSGGMQFLRVRS